MNKLYRALLFSATSCLGLSSCVMQKQYDDLLAEKVRLESALDDCSDSLSVIGNEHASLKNKTASQDSTIASINDRLGKVQSDLDTEKQKNAELSQYYDNLKNSSGKLNQSLVNQQQELLDIRENLDKTREINDKLHQDLLEREKKVAELEEVLAKEAEATQALKNKINNALLSFDESDLKVTTKNGKVYISLAEKLLFKSGSTSIDSKGIQALKQLAGVLKNQSEISIMVEGHTDNIPISKGSAHMKDNWDLSVLRATSIVKILTNNGVPPQQVIAAGKGEHSPIADNKVSENRQKNRRTDIIITPDLNALFDILNAE